MKTINKILQWAGRALKFLLFIKKEIENDNPTNNRKG